MNKIVLAHKLKKPIWFPELEKNLNLKNGDIVKTSWTDKNLKQDIENMIFATEHYDGIGIAANQIGIGKAMFVIVGKSWLTENYTVYLNPNYSINENTQFICEAESCLSVPDYSLAVPRPIEINASWFEPTKIDNEFVFCESVLKDKRAVVFCHEYDHLICKSIVDYQPRERRRKILKELAKL